MQKTPRTFDDVAECVESTLGRVGPRIVLARARGLFSEFPFGTDLTREEWFWQRLLVQELKALGPV